MREPNSRRRCLLFIGQKTLHLVIRLLSEVTMSRLARYKRFSFAAVQFAQQQFLSLRL